LNQWGGATAGYVATRVPRSCSIDSISGRQCRRQQHLEREALPPAEERGAARDLEVVALRELLVRRERHVDDPHVQPLVAVIAQALGEEMGEELVYVVGLDPAFDLGHPRTPPAL
jgi:hypothetical protein